MESEPCVHLLSSLSYQLSTAGWEKKKLDVAEAR